MRDEIDGQWVCLLGLELTKKIPREGRGVRGGAEGE
jgi:hypothetical protein